ncbi:DUF551 domain-containing protein [Methylobacterium bullatum]|uniref:DUF551 domain-containing protein n=1 Tax=Methylobacterium bullatum TaxID=570505 RepID=UPI0037C616AA
MANEAEALRALSEKATQGEWLLRGRFISAPSTNPCIPGQDVIVSTSYSDRRIEEDEANVAFIAALVSAYRSGSLIHRSALAEDTARAEEGWEPIETAPKDGTEVDLWAVKDHGRSAGRRTNCHWGRPVFGAEYFGNPGWRGLENQYSSETPTHWRPLPAPPALPLDKEAAR